MAETVYEEVTLDVRFRDAVGELKRRAGVDVAFAGLYDAVTRTYVLGDVRGGRSRALDGLTSPVGWGLGGKCIMDRVPVRVRNYVQSTSITHQYDHAVTAEGLCSIFAIPVQSDAELHGVLYGAMRREQEIGDRVLSTAESVARDVAARIDRSGEPFTPRPVDAATNTSTISLTVSSQEIREVHADLLSIAAEIDDCRLRARLHQVSKRLCQSLGKEANERGHDFRLTPREIDILAQVAAGCSNREAARRLSLRLETVKSYLKNAMAKLGTHNRMETICVVRRAGLLP